MNLLKGKSLLKKTVVVLAICIILISIILNLKMFFDIRSMRALSDRIFPQYYRSEQIEILFDLALENQSKLQMKLLTNEIQRTLKGMETRVLFALENTLGNSDERFDLSISTNYSMIGTNSLYGINKYIHFFKYLGDFDIITDTELHKAQAIRDIWMKNNEIAAEENLTKGDWQISRSSWFRATKDTSESNRSFSWDKVNDTDPKILANHYVNLIDDLYNVPYTFTDFVSPKILACFDKSANDFLDRITVTVDNKEIVIDDYESKNELFFKMRQVNYKRLTDEVIFKDPVYTLTFIGQNDIDKDIKVDLFDEMVKITVPSASRPDRDATQMYKYQNFNGYYQVNEEEMKKVFDLIETIIS
ncbi:MAG: hypothetical protein ACOCUD_05055 [Bacillota bacterium]